MDIGERQQPVVNRHSRRNPRRLVMADFAVGRNGRCQRNFAVSVNLRCRM